MRARPAHTLARLLVLAVIASARWAAAAPPPGFHAEPAVRVVEVPAGGTGTAAIVLRNDGATSVVAGSITPAAGCAAAVQASPLTGFTLAPSATRTLTISCSPSPPSMQRCGYQVRAPDSSVLLELAAVCAYGDTPSLVPSVTAIDFGSVPVGSAASRTIALHNASAVELHRLFVELTDLAGNFAAAAPCNPDARACDAPISVVAAGATTNLVVTCTPRAAGLLSAELHVTTSAGTRLASPVSVRCTGLASPTPVLSAWPGAIDVGAVEQVGARATATVHLANAGGGPLTLLELDLVDGGTGAASDWSVTADALCGGASPLPCRLEPGQTGDLELVFDPRVIGRRDATLLINYHDTADRSTAIPLRGVGRGATLHLLGGTSTIDFGLLPVGVSGAVELRVENRGTRGLSDASATLTPSGAAFTVAPGALFGVPTGAPTTIRVTCAPETAETFTAALRITAPDVETPPIDLALRCAGSTEATLIAIPPALLLGEVRTATRVDRQVVIDHVGGPISLSKAGLAIGIPDASVSGVPATTPAPLTLSVAPKADGPLIDQMFVTTSAGPMVGPGISVMGTAVTARYEVPTVVSLGTFCVDQPTTPRILALRSTGTATLALQAPQLVSANSPFDLELVAPLAYPATLPPLGRALVAVTPKRQPIAGLAIDDLIWRTDVDGGLVADTRVTASFVDNGPAIAPPALAFGPTPIHLDSRNAQQITLQNCSTSLLQLDPPQVPSPFSIDSPSVPAALQPGETARFSVGFHPTKLGAVTKTLVLTSPQLRNMQLTVALSGEGVAAGTDIDPGGLPAGLDRTSFYACGSCASSDPTGALALALAVLGAIRPRRSRRRSM